MCHLLKKEVCYYENSGTGIYYFKYGLRILDDTSAYLLCAKDEDFYKPGMNYGYNPNMNNGYNPNMNNGYNPNMNNGYNPNMNNTYNPNASTGYSNANYATPVNNTTADTTNNNFNNNGIQQ